MNANGTVTAGDLADLFNGLSQSIDDFRVNAPPGTTTDDLARLKDEAQALENRAHQFIAQDMAETLSRIQPDLQTIVDATAKVQQQIGVLNDVSKAISIATAGVALGAAIATGNIAAIGSTAQAFADSVA